MVCYFCNVFDHNQYNLDAFTLSVFLLAYETLYLERFLAFLYSWVIFLYEISEYRYYSSAFRGTNAVLLPQFFGGVYFNNTLPTLPPNSQTEV